jgi:hypothetical protein
MNQPMTITQFVKEIDLEDFDKDQLKILQELFEDILKDIGDKLK